MAEEPDQTRDDIETTRADLARNVDALPDRTVPSRVARRQWTGIKERVRGVSDKVMGTSGYGAYDAGAGDGRHSAGGAVRDTAATAAATVKDTTTSAVDTVKE
jgi:hypothetical protein